MPRLITEWSTEDPGLAKTLRMLAALPEWDPGRHEGEAMLHMMQARAAWREADRLRESTAARRRGAHPRGTCGACLRSVSLSALGRIRPHGPVEDRCPGSDQEPLAP